MKANLEHRLDALEKQVADLSSQVEELRPRKKDWTKSFGVFANDPDYDEAVRLGREWREAQTYEKEIAGS